MAHTPQKRANCSKIRQTFIAKTQNQNSDKSRQTQGSRAKAQTKVKKVLGKV